MSPKEVLHQMLNLRKQWRNQNFCYTPQQKAEYEKLTMLRRQRVQEIIAVK